MAKLELTLRGETLRPEDTSYEEARRIWNGMIDKRPALIARCASVEDVRDAVTHARAHDLLLAVRGGGHGVAGNAVCDDGLVIDLSQLASVEVDADRRTVRAGGGCRLGDVDRATQEHGLAVPLGVVSRTGIAGLTLSGGMGWLRRKHGLSSDNLVSAEVVTADGRVLTASEDENADLFWALRGGGGNFGVVTSFEYRAHPIGPEVMLLFVLYPGDRAREVLKAMNEYMAVAPDEVGALSFLGRVPHGEMFPAEVHGQPYAAAACVYAGSVADGQEALQPLRELGDSIVDFSAPIQYVEAQKLLDDDYPDGWFYYWKSIEVDGLGDEVLDRLIEHASAAPSDHSTIDVWYNGGAMGRIAPDATAFGERPQFLLGYEANFEHGEAADENVAWVRDSLEELKPHSGGGVYLNFPGFFEEGDALLRASYGDANYERLVEIKTEYDPTNLFRGNGNIPPAA